MRVAAEVRFATPVTGRHATRAPGWWAAPLPAGGHQTNPFPQSKPDRARVVRRGHPFDGWELTVLSRRRAADGQLRLWVELPDGRQRAMLASWTSLEAPPEARPGTRGRASDYAALLKLVEALEPRCGGKEGQLAGAAGQPAAARGGRGVRR